MMNYRAVFRKRGQRNSASGDAAQYCPRNLYRLYKQGAYFNTTENITGRIKLYRNIQRLMVPFVYRIKFHVANRRTPFY